MSKKFLQPHCGSGELSQNDSQWIFEFAILGCELQQSVNVLIYPDRQPSAG